VRRWRAAVILAVAATFAGVVVVAACGASPTSPVPGTGAPATVNPSAAAAPSESPSQAPTAVELTIFAAASLRDAFAAVAEAYEAEHPGVTLTFSFDASSALRAQIEQGAPADVFASADTGNPQALASDGLTTGPPLPFAGSRLAIVVPAANPAGITTPADLARPGVRVVNAGAGVPITAYAAEMLGNLAGQPGYPPSFVAAVAANVVSREDNVRAVLAKVQLGEGDAGIVYATDAAAAGDAVRTIPIPDPANVVATYAAVVPTASPHSDAAEAFVAWLAGAEGRAVLARFGFTNPAS